MTKASLTIPVDPSSELARALADVGVTVILDSDGVRYTVVREDEVARLDTQVVLEGLRQSRGALKGVDTAALLAELSDQRRQHSSGRPD